MPPPTETTEAGAVPEGKCKFRLVAGEYEPLECNCGELHAPPPPEPGKLPPQFILVDCVEQPDTMDPDSGGSAGP